MSSDGHLIIITLKYKLTIQSFTHDKRDNLRNNGFIKLELLNKDESNLMKYIGLKNQKSYYNHEKSFEKLLSKLKGPKNPRIRAAILFHEEEKDSEITRVTSPVASAPPPYESDSEFDE